jgi:hypothetical protein
MPHATQLALLLASPLAQAQPALAAVERACQDVLQELLRLVFAFLSQPVTPEATAAFETQTAALLRELGRRILERTYQRVEPDAADELPARCEWDGLEFSRRRVPTPHRGGLGTLCGTITLHRFTYEPLAEARDEGQRSLAPLELALGIVAGNATPALAERVGRLAAGHTQSEVLETLAAEHGVSWSVSVLRNVTQELAAGLAAHRHAAQKQQLLRWLQQAHASRGRHRPVLAVGRDGIMVPLRGDQPWREAAVGTLSVHDRRGRRLGTVYLGQMPEAQQATLSEELTRLIREVLAEWTGPPPRLAYITDAGHHPTTYFHDVLQRLADPHRPGRCLVWTWVVDFSHACCHLTRLAEALFGDDAAARHAWLRRMRRLLKERPHGVFCVLHSAARLHHDRWLPQKAEAAYQAAYGYLREHLASMQYAAFRRQGLPIGSGVTEAACKTVFTQRFKESGMSWHLDSGQRILDLRVILLSGLWEPVFRSWLQSRPLIPELTRCYNIAI